MQHAHVLVYSSDHVDPDALVHDYVGLDRAEVPHFINELLSDYGDLVGAQSGLGSLDEFESEGAVTLSPQDGTLRPWHIVLRSCQERHDLQAATEAVNPPR